MDNKIEQVITLAKAGYTKEEISALIKADTKSESKEKTEEVKTPATDANNEVLTKVNEALKTMNDTLAKIQLAAINKDEMPKEENVDDILASILNPPSDKK